MQMLHWAKAMLPMPEREVLVDCLSWWLVPVHKLFMVMLFQEIEDERGAIGQSANLLTPNHAGVSRAASACPANIAAPAPAMDIEILVGVSMPKFSLLVVEWKYRIGCSAYLSHDLLLASRVPCLGPQLSSRDHPGRKGPVQMAFCWTLARSSSPREHQRIALK